VDWLPNRNGVRLGRSGSLIGSSTLEADASASEAGGSLEIWLQPRRIWDSGTLIAFYTPRRPVRLALRQSQLDLELWAARPHTRAATLHVRNVFPRTGPLFLTVTSGGQDTAVYIGGVLAKRMPGVQFSSSDLTGTIILGDSAGQGDPWAGQLFGAAVYHRELTAPQVLRHYRTWTQQGRPQIAGDERNAASYLFDERTGRVAHNRAGANADLNIPEKYTVVDQILLEPFWKEFEMSWSYWEAAEKNIVGFIPLGFCFYAYFSSALEIRRAALVTVLCGALVSLTIEIAQAWLPTRDSGTTDLITNTLGTWFGIGLYRITSPVLLQAFPWLDFLILGRQRKAGK